MSTPTPATAKEPLHLMTTEPNTNALKVGDLRYGFEWPKNTHTNTIDQFADLFAIRIDSFTVKGDKYRWSQAIGHTPWWFGTGLRELDWGYATEQEAYAAFMEKVEEAVAFYTDQRSRMVKLWYLRCKKYEDPAAKISLPAALLF